MEKLMSDVQGNEAHERSSVTLRRKELPALLGLRGVAAVAVLLFHLHYLASLPLPPALAFIGTHFGLGVQLFFVLSGFSLCYSTIQSVGSENWIRDYALKRIFRIAPLFYVMIFIWQVVFRIRGVTTDLSTLMLNITFAFGLVPGKSESIVPAGWTIGVEMLFYCILPLLLATIRGLRGAIWVLIVAVAVSASGRAALVGVGGVLEAYSRQSLVSAACFFVLGIVAYHLWRNLPLMNQGVVAVAISTLGLAILLASPLRNSLMAPWRPDVILWGFCFACMTTWQATAPSRLLGSLPFRFFGNRSYGIYLLHPLVIVLLKEPIRQIHATSILWIGEWAFIITGGLVVLVVVLAATATFILVETPSIRAGQWLIRTLSVGIRPGKSGAG